MPTTNEAAPEVAPERVASGRVAGCLTRNMAAGDHLSVFFWRVQSPPGAQTIRVNDAPGSFDLNKDGKCTTADQDWCDAVLRSRLVVIVTRVAKFYGPEQAWILRYGVLTDLKLPNFVHKLSRDDVRLGCEPLMKWAEKASGDHEAKTLPVDEMVARMRAVRFVMRSDFGRFAPLPRFGYGLAVRLGYQDAFKMPGFTGAELAESIAEVLSSHSTSGPELVVLDHKLTGLDCDALTDMPYMRLTKKKRVVHEVAKVPAVLKTFQGLAEKDDKLRVLVRTKENSEAFLIAQHSQNWSEAFLNGTSPHETSVLPQPFAANWVCLLGKDVFWGYARTPRTVHEAARVIVATMNLAHGECPICLDSLGVGQNIVPTCGHPMHSKCAAKLMHLDKKTSPVCPTCRAPLTVDLKGLTKEQRQCRMAERVMCV